VSLQIGKIASTRTSIWNRRRFQFSVGLLLAIILPWTLRVMLAEQDSDLMGLQTAVIGTAIALAAGYYGFRRLSLLPGARASYHIVPSFAISYGIVLTVFFFARFDYSRLQFVASFLLCVAWYYTVYFNLQRQHRLRIGVVPFGDVTAAQEIVDVSWIHLEDPKSDPGPLDAIVADLHADIPEEWQRFLADEALAGTLVMHVKQVQESLTGRVAIDHLSENNFGSLIPGFVYAKVKRLADAIAALIMLPLVAPFMALIGIAIRLDSSGPVLFRQRRVGFRGRVFTMYKFRSMTDRPDTIEDPRAEAVTRSEDDRVTRIGRILRRYRIDELPQIINVLKGEMSWIGPRPEAVALSDWYERELPFYRYRHIVRPGITGWAQVTQGHVADVDDVLWKLHYDFYYIKNFSFWVDVLIIARTIRTIFTGFGAR
jgi:lipopolysaccharide/colanic/teichoic acid biosynthesis glycosyltransferase